MKEANKKVAYLGDGTKETGEKIKAKLVEMGGINQYTFNYQLRDYYFINNNNIIDVQATLPEGYTEIILKESETEKPEINIAELLQGCEGITIGSVFGDVKFIEIDNSNHNQPIVIETDTRLRISLTNDGYWNKESKANGGEVLIYPSKENRDWSSWKKPVRFKKCELIFVSDKKKPDARHLFVAYFDCISKNNKILTINSGTWLYAWKYSDCPLPEFLETKGGRE